jgi:hypothetical protein
MGPKQAWGVFSAILILGVVAASAMLYDLGLDILLVLAFATVVSLVYFYILYKRYNVEVITENDVMLFDNPDDLRILCSIYGLDASGEPGALRQRLLKFVQTNKDISFTWVAPKTVLSLGSVLEMGSSAGGDLKDLSLSTSPLVMSTPRSDSRLSSIEDCPVCGAKVTKKGKICRQCGADLEFYEVLGESKLGKLVLSEKAVVVRRKLRYDVAPLGKK